MADLHHPGLNGFLKRGLLWLAVATGLAVAAKPPVLEMLVAVGAASIIADIQAAFLKKQRARGVAIVGWIGVIAIICWMGYAYLTSEKHSPVGPWDLLAMAAAYQGTRILIFGWVGRMALFDLHGRENSFPGHPGEASPALGTPTTTNETFLSVLPEALQREAEAGWREVILAETGEGSPVVSSLGGLPRLNPGQKWPYHEDQPLDFLAQVDLSEVPLEESAPLRTGLLSFFYHAEECPWGEPDDVGKFSVLFHPDPSQSETVPPGKVAPFPRLPLFFRKARAFCPTAEESEHFDSWSRRLERSTRTRVFTLFHAFTSTSPEGGHRVISHPSLVQGHMDDSLWLAAEVFGLPPETSWTMLLQLDSEEKLGWCWGDAGSLYFWVPSHDLAAARFDRAWVVMQCT